MIRSIQENAEGYPFVFFPKAHAETLGLRKQTKVDIRIVGNELRIIPVAAPLTKEEPQQEVVSLKPNRETGNV